MVFVPRMVDTGINCEDMFLLQIYKVNWLTYYSNADYLYMLINNYIF